jgi:hypothetical protein
VGLCTRGVHFPTVSCELAVLSGLWQRGWPRDAWGGGTSGWGGGRGREDKAGGGLACPPHMSPRLACLQRQSCVDFLSLSRF